MEFNTPILICGAPGSGTSLVTKILRYSGLFAGADAGPISARKFHESTCFQNANNQLLTATIGFPHAPKSSDQFHSHVKILETKLNELIEKIDLVELLTTFWGDQPQTNLWGWKDPRNAANVLFWRNVFPGLRVITIQKKWRWSERKVLGTLAGNWYRSQSTKSLRKIYMHPPHTESLQTHVVDFDNLFNGSLELHKLWMWLGIEPEHFPDCQEFIRLVDSDRQLGLIESVFV